MQLKYKDYIAKLYYSVFTKSYYGELEIGQKLVNFQASNRADAIKIVHLLVDTMDS